MARRRKKLGEILVGWNIITPEALNDAIAYATQHAKRVGEALVELELASEEDVFAQDKRYAIRINDEFTVDVMPAVAGLTWAELQSHVTQMDIDGVSVRVLDLAGLLKTKQGVRPKDQMDAAVIRAALERLGRK